jgi:hypothetical protein
MQIQVVHSIQSAHHVKLKLKSNPCSAPCVCVEAKVFVIDRSDLLSPPCWSLNPGWLAYMWFRKASEKPRATVVVESSNRIPEQRICRMPGLDIHLLSYSGNRCAKTSGTFYTSRGVDSMKFKWPNAAFDHSISIATLWIQHSEYQFLSSLRS